MSNMVIVFVHINKDQTLNFRTVFDTLWPLILKKKPQRSFEEFCLSDFLINNDNSYHFCY